jgi:hypothetical protein
MWWLSTCGVEAADGVVNNAKLDAGGSFRGFRAQSGSRGLVFIGETGEPVELPADAALAWLGLDPSSFVCRGVFGYLEVDSRARTEGAGRVLLNQR